MVIRVSFWVYIQNLFDGSACAKFYKSREEAEAEASKCDERYCDDVYKAELFVNTVTGQIV